MNVFLATALLWPFVAIGATVDIETCSANGRSSEACQATTAAEASGLLPEDFTNEELPGFQSGVHSQPVAMADLVTQEIEELENYIKLCEDRIVMLNDIQGVVDSGFNITAAGVGGGILPEAHLRALTDKFPLLSEAAVDSQTSPVGSPDDYLVSKSVITPEEAVSFVKFLPLKSKSKAVDAGFPAALLVSATVSGVVRLYTPAGESLTSFNAGHADPVAHLTVSPAKDEHSIATADSSGNVRVFKVSIKPVNPPTDAPKGRVNLSHVKMSKFLGTQLDVKVQFQGELSAKDGTRITTIALTSVQGFKYFVMGDEQGKISIFTKNGTLQAALAAADSNTRVDAIYSERGTVIFRAGLDWGFVDFDRLQLKRAECYGFAGRMVAAAVDSQHNWRVVIADEVGQVWSLNTKRDDCRVEHRFREGTTKGVVELATIRGFVLGLERVDSDSNKKQAQWSIVALNMSSVGKSSHELSKAHSPVAWRLPRDPVRSWAVHQRSQTGDLLAFLSADGRSIEVMELFMVVFTPPEPSNFWTVKFPIFVSVVVFFIGWFWWKRPPTKSNDNDMTENVANPDSKIQRPKQH
eukprot:TRINITY_DN15861_c0_g1_i1.p1 TRINITY_DN15861_c0_g1~~TRINITY_DN15861_c0_g1_i1.p1  ORF type:complete len:580 (-),score=122.63 TRINITY_DN15861_c0_g1_i1:212-1951(-)